MLNPMQLLGMLKGGQANPENMMNIFGSNPMFQQAQKMLQGGGNPQEIIKNVAKQKGISTEQLQEMAKQFNVKL